MVRFIVKGRYSVGERTTFGRSHVARIALMALLSMMAGVADAEDSLSAGNTAWVLTSTALVLFMTLPGLSLFYGGLVRSKNVLSILMQCSVMERTIEI